MLQLQGTWRSHLKSEFDKPYFRALSKFVHSQYSEQICYPPIDQLFNAFNSCSFEAVRVVIIGQDPYHGKGQANGLCFSVNKGMAYPPSLRNIFKELELDMKLSPPVSGDLTEWAHQGVFLLNSTLSVRSNQAGSHQKQGWENFTDQVIITLSEQKTDLIFLLWGNLAKNKKKLIDMSKHVILESGHPSPLSANRGYWFGNNHFSKTNALLSIKGKSEIKWGSF
jgi:uracil-DNA glycosylase